MYIDSIGFEFLSAFAAPSIAHTKYYRALSVGKTVSEVLLV